MIKDLFEKLTQVTHVYLSEVVPARANYHGFGDSDVKTTANGNCIIMREQEGGMINLKNLDERATIIRYEYVWTFLGNCVKLERYKKQKSELLLEMYEEDGQLFSVMSDDVIHFDLTSEILLTSDFVEVTVSKGRGTDVSHFCLEFSNLRRTEREQRLVTDG